MEVSPMTNESIVGAHLEDVQTKLDELSERGWTLTNMAATRGNHTFVMQRESTGPRMASPRPSDRRGKKDKKNKNKKKKKKK